MKRFATALVLLLLTLTLSIGAQLIFSKKTDELITGLEALLCAVDAGEGEERALENVEKAWLGSKKILHILLVHRDKHKQLGRISRRWRQGSLAAGLHRGTDAA